MALTGEFDVFGASKLECDGFETDEPSISCCEAHQHLSLDQFADKVSALPKATGHKDNSLSVKRVCAGPASIVIILDDGRVVPIVLPKRYASAMQALSRFNVSKIAFGGSHFVAITNEGHLWTYGMNQRGQLGQGSVHNHIGVLAKINAPIFNAIDVSCGTEHSIALTDKGDVYTWGSGMSGQLGTGRDIHTVPKYVSHFGLDCRIVQVAAGEYFSAALSDDGSLYMCGDGTSYQLGVGRKTNAKLPVKVPLPKAIRKVQCGFGHVVALSVDGDVYSWGLGKCGQIGHGSCSSVEVPSTINVEEHEIYDILSAPFASVFITKTGAVLTCGSTQKGRIGHSPGSHVTMPTVISSIARKSITFAAVSRMGLACFTRTCIQGCKTSAVSAIGGTQLCIGGPGISTLNREGVVRFSVGNIFQELIAITCGSNGIVCETPDLSSIPHERYPVKLAVELSLDGENSFTEPFFINVYRIPSALQKCVRWGGPIAGMTEVALKVELDDADYSKMQARLSSNISGEILKPSVACYDRTNREVRFVTPPARKSGKHSFELNVDEKSFVHLGSSPEESYFLYYEALVVKTTPRSLPWCGGKLCVTVKGLDDVNEDSVENFSPTACAYWEGFSINVKGTEVGESSLEGRVFEFTIPAMEPTLDRSPKQSSVKVSFNGQNYTEPFHLEICSPTPETIRPESGPTRGGTLVRLSGKGFFKTGSIRVRLRDIESGCQVKENPNEQIATGSFDDAAGEVVFEMPPRPAGMIAVDIACDQDAKYSNASIPFNIYDEPTGFKIDPSSGPMAGGTQVRLSAKGLIEAPNASVQFVSTVQQGESTEERKLRVPAQFGKEDKKGGATYYSFESPPFCEETPCKVNVLFSMNGTDFVSTGATFTYIVPK